MVTVNIDRAAAVAYVQAPNGDVARVIAKAGVRVQTQAKRLCPVDTGRLRSSITMEMTQDSSGPVALVGTNVEYAPYVEFGTSRMRAQPYLRPALKMASV